MRGRSGLTGMGLGSIGGLGFAGEWGRRGWMQRPTSEAPSREGKDGLGVGRRGEEKGWVVISRSDGFALVDRSAK
jgi:hypothetical protein